MVTSTGFGPVNAAVKGQCVKLCSTTWLRDNSGRLLLTPKEDLRTVLKMSPDIGDAAALTYVERYNGDDPVIKATIKESLRDKRMRALAMMGD